MVFADAIDVARGFVTALFYVYLICIFLYIITSWIHLPYNVWLNRVQRFLYDVVNPYLSIFRRLLPQLSGRRFGLDFTPIIAIIVLYALFFVAGTIIDQFE